MTTDSMVANDFNAWTTDPMVTMTTVANGNKCNDPMKTDSLVTMIVFNNG